MGTTARSKTEKTIKRGESPGCKVDGLLRTGRLLTHHKSAMINWCGGTHQYVHHSGDRSRIVSLRPSGAVSKNKKQKELKEKKKVGPAR